MELSDSSKMSPKELWKGPFALRAACSSPARGLGGGERLSRESAAEPGWTLWLRDSFKAPRVLMRGKVSGNTAEHSALDLCDKLAGGKDCQNIQGISKEVRGFCSGHAPRHK